jgi:hypothetical protein
MTASRQNLTAPSEGCQVEGRTSPQNTNRNSPFQSQSRLQIIGLPFMTRVIYHGARQHYSPICQHLLRTPLAPNAVVYATYHSLHELVRSRNTRDRTPLSLAISIYSWPRASSCRLYLRSFISPFDSPLTPSLPFSARHLYRISYPWLFV